MPSATSAVEARKPTDARTNDDLTSDTSEFEVITRYPVLSGRPELVV